MKQLAILATFTLLSACATITASADQDIAITTQPAGASCVLSNTQQSVTVNTTPGTANVQRMFEPLNVTCTLPGYSSGEAIIEAKTRGRAWGNILLFGVPAVVDSSTGKGYEYDPAELHLTLVPAVPAAQ